MLDECFSNCEKVFDFFIKLDPFSKTFANLFNYFINYKLLRVLDTNHFNCY